MRRQRAHVVFTKLRGIYRRQHFHNHQTVVPAIELYFIRCIRDTHRNNRHPSGNSRVKSPGFKRQQAAAAATGPFREHPERNFTLFKSVDDFGNSAVRFGSVITVNQQIARQPVQLAKERDPQQALFTYGDRRSLHDIRRRHHIIVVLVVSDVDRVAIAFRVGGFA